MHVRIGVGDGRSGRRDFDGVVSRAIDGDAQRIGMAADREAAVLAGASVMLGAHSRRLNAEISIVESRHSGE